MNTFTDTLWNNFNKRHQWIFDAADKIRAQDRAIAASGTVASHAPHRAAARLGHSVTVNYRKEGEQ